MEIPAFPLQHPKIGWHYYPDTSHYRGSDFSRWLPELQSLGASWVTLFAPEDYAIPESFITGLVNANIQPIIHFHPSISKSPRTDHIQALLNAYASWGVRYAMFYDRPNQITSWLPSGWAKDKLVERFLDHFLPYAEATLASGLTPILPPLEPGGNYWDLSFLSELLSAIVRRVNTKFLDHLVLGIYAKAGNRPLNWGAGGPERWPASQPYYTPNNSQDHIGFRIFDWYIAISRAILNKSLPVFLFGSACNPGDHNDKRYPPITEQEHAICHITIAKALVGEDTEFETIPAEVLACNFWPLVASPGYPEAKISWYQINGEPLPAVEAMKTFVNSRNITQHIKSLNTVLINNHPIAHYLLLTEESWKLQSGNSVFLQNFLQKYKPTIGFSIDEAVLAKRVTILGDRNIFPETLVAELYNSGCQVERIGEDGTIIAPVI
jgi:hypothetical protein